MKTLKFMPLIISVLFLISCGKSDEPKPPSVEYQKTILGGCNIVDDPIDDPMYGPMDDPMDDPMREHNDTIAISMINDTIHVFVGHNYSCGAPFKTQCEIIDDIVYMYIIDTCPDSRCYKRCTCYYTFDFVFIKKAELNQNYKIVLISPNRENSITIIEEDNFQNKILM